MADRPARGRRSRAHRTLLFEYLLGLTLIGTGLLGMTAMQAQLLLLRTGTVEPDATLGLWRGLSEYEGDDARGLSASLRVCGDGLDRAVDLACWRDQLDTLLAPASRWERHRLMVAGAAREVMVRGLGADAGESPGLRITDAGSGETLWQLQGGTVEGYDDASRTFRHPLLLDAVGPEVAVVDADQDGFVDRLYAGDAGGRLWRVDLAGVPEGGTRSAANVQTEHPRLWQALPVFTTGADGRRFGGAPDVVQASDRDGRYDAILIGSVGDGTGQNWFYMVKDRAVVSGLPTRSVTSHEQLHDLSHRCAAADPCGSAAGSLARGWRVRLDGNGENFHGRAVTAAGNVFFTTWTSFGADCSGREMLYAVSLRDARPVFRIDSTTARDAVQDDLLRIVGRAGGGTLPCTMAARSG